MQRLFTSKCLCHLLSSPTGAPSWCIYREGPLPCLSTSTTPPLPPTYIHTTSSALLSLVDYLDLFPFHALVLPPASPTPIPCRARLWRCNLRRTPARTHSNSTVHNLLHSAVAAPISRILRFHGGAAVGWMRVYTTQRCFRAEAVATNSRPQAPLHLLRVGCTCGSKFGFHVASCVSDHTSCTRHWLTRQRIRSNTAKFSLLRTLMLFMLFRKLMMLSLVRVHLNRSQSRGRRSRCTQSYRMAFGRRALAKPSYRREPVLRVSPSRMLYSS